MDYDVIIIGSGAGGCAVAYHLTQSGKRVLLLEKGTVLPRDGSTLDADKVLRRGMFLSDEPWFDRHGATIVPEEHFNLGGKTKWYGAALLRFAAHEFAADADHACLAWPFPYEELAPFYDEAEKLLGVRQFGVEANFQQIVSGLRRRDAQWRRQPMSLGLAAEILSHPEEARHFDAFASVRGLKCDAETSLLARVSHKPNLTILTGKAVSGFVAASGDATRVNGVVCDDGSRHHAAAVVIAAGTLHSPRLLQSYLERTGLAEALPSYQQVGRNYKAHVLTAMLALSHRPVTDVLCKTLLLLHDGMPHSTVQTLGGNLAEEIVRSQMPRLCAAKCPASCRTGWRRRSPRGFMACSCRPRTGRIRTIASSPRQKAAIARCSSMTWPACPPPRRSTGVSYRHCNASCLDWAMSGWSGRFRCRAPRMLVARW
ncbi:MAG: Paromamine 6'-oxidase [Candidatus Accumulibacter sp. BA-94]|nr:MAG: Paromamine 6'-oxidase [Candidatus Accumulibacter sp. BA-94]